MYTGVKGGREWIWREIRREKGVKQRKKKRKEEIIIELVSEKCEEQI